MTTEAVARQHAPRPPLIGQGLAAALLGAVLLALAWVDENALLGGVALVQLLGVLGFLAVTEAPASQGVFGLGIAAALAADIVVVADDGRARYLGAVVALSLVA